MQKNSKIKAIQIEKVTIKYNDKIILQNLNFDIDRGTLNFILGGNGAGKSTLIRSIMGLHKNYQGTIKIFSKPNNQKTISKHIAYVPQYINIDRTFPITVKEFIWIECHLKKSCPVGILGHLKLFNLQNLKDKKISELSGGQFQKLLIARSLISNSDILILDEPTNNLDKKAHEVLSQIIKEQLENNVTIIIVTHNIKELGLSKQIAKIFKIKKGRIYESSN